MLKEEIFWEEICFALCHFFGFQKKKKLIFHELNLRISRIFLLFTNLLIYLEYVAMY